jgi:serine/threonine-protein kinase
MPPITELTGRYHLHELIAVGGMGEVWRAADRVLARPVAVKLLRPEYSGDEVTLIRFRAEARHAGLLAHPGIAQVYDYQDATPERPAYLVMELVDGPSLAGVLAGRRLVPEHAADVLAQAAAALQAAHAAGVLHRDIKPGNLLLTSDGRVKMTDFGVAQSVLTGNLTRTGSMVGTTGYLAPERVSGRQATVASDLYALGIVGYECLTGQPPFQGEPLQVALAHRDQDLPGLPPWCLSQPGAAVLAALIADLTAKDPAARPGSAALVAERARDLRNGLAGWRHTPAGPTRPDGAARAAGPEPANVLPASPPPAGAPPADVAPPYVAPADVAPAGTMPGVPSGTPSEAPSGTRRRHRMAAVGLPGGILAAGLLGWLLATVQAHPASAPPAQPGARPALAQQTTAPDRSAAPARPAPGRSVSTAAPRQTPPARAAGGTHVSPGRAKHGERPPHGHR